MVRFFDTLIKRIRTDIKKTFTSFSRGPRFSLRLRVRAAFTHVLRKIERRQLPSPLQLVFKLPSREFA